MQKWGGRMNGLKLAASASDEASAIRITQIFYIWALKFDLLAYGAVVQ